MAIAYFFSSVSSLLQVGIHYVLLLLLLSLLSPGFNGLFHKGMGCKESFHSSFILLHGGLIQYPEGALRATEGNGEDKINRNHADLLRYSHRECGQPRKMRVGSTYLCSLMFYAWKQTLREWWLHT